MDRLSERTAAIVAALAGGFALVDALFGAYAGLRAMSALAPLLWTTAAVAALVAARYALERRALEERQDADLARRERPDSALFGPQAESDEALPAVRLRAQFEAVVVRAAAPILALVQGAWARQAWRTLMTSLEKAPVARLGAAATLVAQAFALFLAGRYLLGLARAPERRLLRGPGARLGLCALASLATAGFTIAGHVGWTAADRTAAMVWTGLLALLAAENAIGFILDMYRPRRRDEPPRAAYESWIARRLVEPEGWIRDAAQSLDYQFGFKVSETWFYRFLRSALAPLLLFQILVLYALSGVVILGPEEEGILERFGRPHVERQGGWRLGPGLHWKWPWPFETVRRFPARSVQRLHVGFRYDESRPWPKQLLWTRPHFEEEDSFLLAARESTARAEGRPDAVPVNLLAMNLLIEYRIRDLSAFAYRFADPPAALRALAYRALTRELAHRDLFALLGPERESFMEQLRATLQTDADRTGLGVGIEFVGLHNLHPPVPVADAFEAVVGALEQREAAILNARAYRHRRAPIAEGEARRVVAEAEAYRFRREQIARAEAEQFRVRLDAAARAPAVFRNWYSLQALAEALPQARLYVVTADPTAEVFQFNFEERLPSTLFDLSLLNEEENKVNP